MSIKQKCQFHIYNLNKAQSIEELDQLQEEFWTNAKLEYGLDQLDGLSEYEQGLKISNFRKSYGTLFRKELKNLSLNPIVVAQIEEGFNNFSPTAYKNYGHSKPLMYVSTPSFLEKGMTKLTKKYIEESSYNRVSDISYSQVLEMEAVVKSWLYSDDIHLRTMSLIYFLGRRPVEVGLTGRVYDLGHETVIGFDGFAKKNGRSADMVILPCKLPTKEVIRAIDEIQDYYQGIGIVTPEDFHKKTKDVRGRRLVENLKDFTWIEQSYDFRALFPATICYEVVSLEEWGYWLDCVYPTIIFQKGGNRNSGNHEIYKYLLSHESTNVSQKYQTYRISN